MSIPTNSEFVLRCLQLETRVNDCANRLENRMTRASQAAEEVVDAKINLAAKRNEIVALTDPKELGSNEAQRNAVIDGMLGEYIDKLHSVEDTQRVAQFNLACSQLAFDATKLQIRLLEAASRFAGAGE